MLLKGNSFNSFTNCQSDITTIFDSIALELDPMIQDFHKKNNYALGKLRKLNNVLATVTLPDDMDETKAKFCKTQQANLQAIDFDEIYNHLMMGSQRAILSFKKIHLSFYCMLCDYKAHNEFNLQGKSIRKVFNCQEEK